MIQEKKAPDRFELALADYQDKLRERSLSDETIDSYSRDLRSFFAFCRKRDCSQPEDLCSEHVIAYLEMQKRSGRAASTMSRRASAVKGFCRFMQDEKVQEQDISQNITTPKTRRPDPDYLTEEETEKLMSLPDKSKPLGLRDKAILELMYACGLRASEVIGISEHDFRDNMAVLCCRGKGSKERYVPVGEAARDAVRDYLVNARNLLLRRKITGELFLNSRGGKLSRSGLWRIIEGYGEQLHIYEDGKKLHPHALRHSAATHMLERGADLRIVQEFLGHSDISTTQIYTEIDVKKRAAVYNSYHPRAKMKRGK